MDFLPVSIVLTYILIASVMGDCPQSNGAFRRVGQTRFFIIHPTKRGEFLTIEEARNECTKQGLKMATVKSLLTMAVLGRQLEQLVFAEKLMDTWYWLDGKYSENQKSYVWGESEALQFSLFNFRPPRPLGIGTHINYNNIYQPEVNKSQCLTIALPHPGIADYTANSKVFFGHQTTFDERDCKSKKKRHAICESSDPGCISTESSPYKLDEGKESYFYEGNWIFGNRTYLANWKQRNFKDSAAYCTSMGLNLLTAGRSDKDLTSFIKLWARDITVSQFWTSMKYNTETNQFLDAAGNVIPNELTGANFTVKPVKVDKELCVTLSVSLEFVEQTPCGDATAQNGCQWNFFQYAPSNCNNYHGSICQHKDYAIRELAWYPPNNKDLTETLQKTAATSEFGFLENYLIQRSKYKQTFGLFYCPDEYRALRTDKNAFTAWSVKPTDETEFFSYEYAETYWVVDDEMYNKTENSSCTVASFLSDKVKYQQVKCNEWHFYLCIKNGRRPGKKLEFEVNNAPPMEWKPGPQPRLYPIKK